MNETHTPLIKVFGRISKDDISAKYNWDNNMARNFRLRLNGINKLDIAKKFPSKEEKMIKYIKKYEPKFLSKSLGTWLLFKTPSCMSFNSKYISSKAKSPFKVKSRKSFIENENDPKINYVDEVNLYKEATDNLDDFNEEMQKKINKKFRTKKLRLNLDSVFHREKRVDEFHMRLTNIKHKNEYLKETYSSRLKKSANLSSEFIKVNKVYKDAFSNYKKMFNTRSPISRALSLEQIERRKRMKNINKEKRKIESNLDYNSKKDYLKGLRLNIQVK